MRTKLYFGMFAAATLFATSCSSDDFGVQGTSGNEVLASFTIETPGSMKSRTAGDGTTVDKVKCVVYDNTGKEIEGLTETLDIAGKKATYNTRFVKGQSYRVAFFAYNEDADAYDIADLKNIVVKTDKKANLENRDAFTAYTDVTTTETMSAINRTVTLYRPFAQLNIGAFMEDIAAAEAAGIVLDQTAVEVSNVYTNFSAYDDAVVVGAETTTMTFSLNELRDEYLHCTDTNYDTTTDYKYLSLSYLLVGDKGTEKSLTDVKFTWHSTDGKTNSPITEFKNVPVQRNWRTNIIGYILTNPAQFNIVIDNNFENEYNLFEPWDGTTYKEVAENAGVYEVSCGAELAWIAKQVNEADASKRNTFEGKTVKLTHDIYLADAQWIAIGEVNSYPGITFAGTFDGNGYTIYDLNVSDQTPGYASAGLFGSITGKVQNVTVDGAKVASTHYAGVICGYSSANGAEISNCHVKNAVVTSTPEWTGSKWDNGDKAGGIAGYIVAGDKITDCTVENATISAYRDFGGVVGCAPSTSVVNSTATNIELVVNNEHNYKNLADDAHHNAGLIIGRTTDENSGLITNTTEFLAAVKAFNESSDTEVTLVLNGDIEWATGTNPNIGTSPFKEGAKVTIQGGKVTATGDATLVAPTNGSLTFKGLDIVDNTKDLNTSWNLSYLVIDGKVSFEGCTFKNNVMFRGDITATDCNFENKPNTANADEYTLWVRSGNVTLDGCTFADSKRGVKVHDDAETSVKSVKIDNCSFTNINGKPGVVIGNSKGVTITNSTFENCQPGDQGMFIYETDKYAPAYSNNTIKLGKNEYTLAATFTLNNNTTVEGVRGTVVNGNIIANNGSVKNLTINGSAYNAIEARPGGAITFENVVFNVPADGTHNIYKEDSNLGNGRSETVTFKGCTFNANGQRPMQVDLCNTIVDGCTFNNPYRYCLQLGDWARKCNITFTNNQVLNIGSTNKEFYTYIQVGPTAHDINITLSGNSHATHAKWQDTVVEDGATNVVFK